MKFNTYGLNSVQVASRIKDGKFNKIINTNTKSVSNIIKDNLFTFFNLLNLVLALLIVAASINRPHLLVNLTFITVIFINTIIGIIQEIQAKKTVDQLTIITQPKVEVIREGINEVIDYDKIVLDDVIVLKSGDQVPVDCKLIECLGLEVDESMLTGESDSIRKEVGDELWSGSIIIAGSCYAVATAVGTETFSGKLSSEAKKIKRDNSKLKKSLNIMLKLLSFIIVPAGILLFAGNFFYGGNKDIALSTVKTVSIIIGMIPEGLILLTSVSMAAGVIVMGKHNSLIQRLSSIETLARTDVLCLDKTGTITTGKIKFQDLILVDENQSFNFYKDNDNKKSNKMTTKALSALIAALPAANETQKAIAGEFVDKPNWEINEVIPFSSERKHSKVDFKEHGTWILGAPEFVNCKISSSVNDKIETLLEEGYRILVLAESDTLEDEVSELRGIIVMSDEIREDVNETFAYFEKQDVSIKIISGDNPKSVYAIAKRADIIGLNGYINMKYVRDEDIAHIVKNNSVFGRVSPFQKKALIKALQAEGHIVAMTGDGVNDVPALKQADCSIAMASGSDASKNVADIILMKNNIASLVHAVYEGRRIINNIQKVASLFLVKTTYSSILAIFFVFWAKGYPVMPIQMTFINALTIGIPSFFLALRPNKDRVTGSFMDNYVRTSVPIGIITAAVMIALQFTASALGINGAALSTMSTIVLSAAGVLALFLNCRPFTKTKIALFVACTIALIATMILFGEIVFIDPLNQLQLIISAITVISIFGLYKLTHSMISNSVNKYSGTIKKLIPIKNI
ncbi:HAD-IC family P-type ATPase [Microaceticoccus formicicus]|uniref:HAD-IC family P-type ATPase n=1 Tax=Microaceticoccus formicicus TaxID=3118105 RepID=UPI003CD023A0|nr:HAD-IC family P-type ATPase [Peptoniphilaceae bacterium AMB_02]